MESIEPLLLVEDDAVDALSVKRALQELDVSRKLVHVTCGQEALAYLGSETRTKPSLILLDLNMPEMGGIELLRAIKSDDALQAIPVVVLTTSGEQSDVLDSFGLSVAGYVVKPFDFDQLRETIKTIDSYWRLSQLPMVP
jgi:CheY-like chemotaxis protein